jgi:hypothetical protein
MENNKPPIFFNGSDYAPQIRNFAFKIGVFIAGAVVISRIFNKSHNDIFAFYGIMQGRLAVPK